MTKDNIKGFDGLESLVSRINIESHARKQESSIVKQEDIDTSDSSAALKNQKWSSTDTSVSKKDRNGQSEKNNNSYNTGLYLIVGVIVVAFIIGNITNNDRKNKVKYKSLPTYTQTPSYETPIIKSKPKQKSTPEPLSYEKPPVGTNLTLYISQIRWCVREKNRLDSIQHGISDNAGVDKYNRRVQDYNNRCGQFRYRIGDLERAKREVAKDNKNISLENTLKDIDSEVFKYITPR